VWRGNWVGISDFVYRISSRGVGESGFARGSAATRLGLIGFVLDIVRCSLAYAFVLAVVMFILPILKLALFCKKQGDL